MKKLIAAVVAVALFAGFLGYTKPGRQLLNAMGLATACDGSCS